MTVASATAPSARGRVMCSVWKLVAVAAAFILLHSGAAEAQEPHDIQDPLETRAQENVSPYLLVASVYTIYRIYPNGTGMHPLVMETTGGIMAVDCHFRMDYMFWTNRNERVIKRARLNGTNITEFIAGDVLYPADVAVDWINDKLYWSDRDYKKIEEVDIITGQRRIVIQLDATSIPLGLVVYPLEGHGLLYWMDRGRGTLDRCLTTGRSHTTLHTDLGCVWPLTLDYQNRMIYWTNYCRYSIESLNINGANHSFVVESDNDLVYFTTGMTQFEGVVYWTQPQKVYMMSGVHITQLYEGHSTQILKGIQVVHPRSQPTAEQLRQGGADTASVCRAVCENGGDCILPGVCVCPDGWTGLTCTEDVNECLSDNGGCQHECRNVDGSFLCFCPEGYTLGNDGQTCIDVNECSEGTHACQGVCDNTLGSYRCMCGAGFTLSSDGHTCEDTGLPVIPPPIIRPPSTAGFSIHQDESFSGIGPVETLLPVSTSLPTHVLASRDHPLGVDASQHVDGGMGVFPTRVIASSTPGPQPTTAHLVNSFSSSIDGVTLTVTNLDLEVRTTTHYLGPSTTQQSGHQSTVKTLAVSKKVPAVTRLELNSGVLQTPLPSSLTVVVPAFNPPDLPDIGLVPPTIKGLDNGSENDTKINPLVVIVTVCVVIGLIILAVSALLFSAVYIHCKKAKMGSYSFVNPMASDMLGNTLKRGQVTRMSFRQIDPTNPTIPATMAMLSPQGSPALISGLSGSDSFEWNIH